MRGLPPEALPSVFSVGPGLRMTYGTGRTAATTAATTTATPATSRVRARRGMVRRLRVVDPLVGTVAEVLVLPDGHARLDLVDQGVTAVQRLGPVRAGHRTHDREVAHHQVAHPVRGGQPADGEVGGHLRRDPAQFVGGRRMS